MVYWEQEATGEGGRSMEEKQVGRDLSAGSEEARREAARLMGSARTERKAAAARENARKRIQGGGRPFKPIAEIECTCGAGMELKHSSRCPRGQAIKRRQEKGLPIE